MARRTKVAVLPGDGIGPEVTQEAVKVLSATGINFEFIECSVGGRAYLEIGTPLPQEAMEACDEADAVLFGAVGHDYAPYGIPRKVLIYLRMEKNAYVNVRPLKLYPGVPTLQDHPSYPEVDLVIIRDNSEGIALQHDGYLLDESGLDKRVITYSGAQRIVAFAIDYAKKHGRSKVSCIDKSTWLYSDKIFRSAFERVAGRQKEVETECMSVDMAAMTQVQKPGHFDVIVTPDIYGDILSGIAVAQIGGVAMAPSASMGDKFAYFEPIHGTAWDMAGEGVANPIGSILSAKLMLEWLKREEEARSIEAAIYRILEEGNVLTPDLGGSSSTSEVGDAISDLVAGEPPHQDVELETVQVPR